MIGIESTGIEQFTRKLQRIAEAQTDIARGVVVAGTGVFVKVCRDAAPGSTKGEIGRTITASGSHAEGRAGLMQYPKYAGGKQVNKAHLVYITRGTKFITPRRYVENALASSRPAAIAAVEKSVNDKIERAIVSIS